MGSSAPVAPTVVVTDKNGKPLVGVGNAKICRQLRWGCARTHADSTNTTGTATATKWTLGSTAGTNTVTASVAGVAVVVSTAVATDPCAPIALTFPGTVTGTIGANSCVVSQAGRAVYELVLSAETNPKLDGQSPTGSGWCNCVYDPNGEFIVGVPGGATYYRLAAGRYKVLVDGKSLTAAGNYSFSTTAEVPAAGCSRVYVSRGVTLANASRHPTAHGVRRSLGWPTPRLL